jgi:phage portal protein BeeE
VTVSGKTLPNLPPSMVQILSSSKRSSTQTILSALVARANTPWVIQGADTLRFNVAKNKRSS